MTEDKGKFVQGVENEDSPHTVCPPVDGAAIDSNTACPPPLGEQSSPLSPAEQGTASEGGEQGDTSVCPPVDGEATDSNTTCPPPLQGGGVGEGVEQTPPSAADAPPSPIDGGRQEGEQAAHKSSVSKIIKRSLLIAGYAILALLLVLVGWLCIDKFILKNPVPSVFGYSWCTVKTASMSGMIEEGDLVINKKTNDYEMGDVITFIQDGDEIPTTHMIFQVLKDDAGNVTGYITRGVANNADDSSPVSPDEIIGEVVGTIPQVGLFFNWFKGVETSDSTTESNDNNIIVPGWLYFAGIILIIAVGIFMYYKFLKEPNEPVELPAADEGNGSEVEAHSDAAGEGNEEKSEGKPEEKSEEKHEE